MAEGSPQKVSIEGRTLVFDEWGPKDGSPLVCVHGFTGRGGTYQDLAGAVPERHVLAPTLRGHGHSEWAADESYQLRDYVRDLEGFARHRSLGSFDLLGTSMGGWVSIPFVAAHPEMVRRLVLHDIGPEEVPAAVKTQDSMFAFRRQAHPSVAAWAEAARALPRFASQTTEELMATGRALLRQREDGLWVERFDPVLLDHRVERFEGPDLWEEFASIRCPILLIWGHKSIWLSEANVRRMQAVGHNVELIESPDEGHAPNLLGPLVFPGLQAFLAG